MARTKGGLKGFSGLLGPIVIKQYADKTVVTSRPDMSRVAAFIVFMSFRASPQISF